MAGIVLGASLLLGFLLHDLGTGWYALPAVAAGAALAVAARPERRTALLAALALVCVLLAFWRAASAGVAVRPALPTEEVRYQGTIFGIPSRSPDGATVRVHLRSPQPGVAWVLVPALPEVHEADVIAFKGRAETDPGLRDPETLLPSAPPGAPVIYAPTFWVVGSEAGTLARVRARAVAALRSRLEGSIPEPAGSLAVGVLLGDDDDMTASAGDAFRAAGLSHITAVSGWNVALVAGLLALVAGRGRLRLPLAVILSAVGIWGFAYLVGMGPSVVRAAVMGTLALVAGWRGRPADAATSLAWASAGMVFLRPGTGHDIGFQLSVAATAAIVVTAPLLASWPRWTLVAAVPLVAQLAVAPLLLHHFGTYSLIAPLANVVVAPLVPAVMFGALMTGLASLVHPVLGAAAGIGAWLPGRIMIAVAEWAAAVPYLSGRTIPLSWGGVAVAYAALGATYGLLWYRRFGAGIRQAEPLP